MVPFTEAMEKSTSGMKVSLFLDMVTSKRTWVMCVGLGSDVRSDKVMHASFAYQLRL